MTTYCETSNQNYLVLPGNAGILITSDNVNSKNGVEAKVAAAMDMVLEVLKNVIR